MKLHLPKLLRNSVLACITAVAGIVTTTVGTATFTGGVVAFALSGQQAVAGWSADRLTNGYFYYYDQSDNPGIVTAPVTNGNGYASAADALQNFRIVSGEADKENVFEVLQAQDGCSFQIVENPWQTDSTYSHLSIQKLIFGSAVSGSDEYDGSGKGAFLNKQVESTVSIDTVGGALSGVENAGILTLGSAEGTINLAGSIVNTGTLNLAGKLKADTMDGFTLASGGSTTLTEGTHGFRQGTMTYNLATGGTINRNEGFSFYLGEEDITSQLTVADGGITYTATGISSLYEVTSAYTTAVVYNGTSGDTASATGFLMEGGTTLVLESENFSALSAGVTINAGEGGKVNLTIANGQSQAFSAVSGLVTVQSGGYVLGISGAGTEITTTNQNSAGFYQGEVSITNGGKLSLNNYDALGWEGTATPKISILNGTLAVGGRQTCSTNIEMLGGAVIEAGANPLTGGNAPMIQTHEGFALTVSGTGNKIARDVAIKMGIDTTVTVAEGGELSILGAITQQKWFFKEGAGKLILDGADKNLEGAMWMNAGTLVLGGTVEDGGVTTFSRGIYHTSGVIEVGGKSVVNGNSTFGSMTVKDGGDMTLKGTSTLGATTVKSGGNLTLGGTVTWDSEVTVEAGGALTLSGLHTVGGNLTIADGGKVYAGSGMEVDADSMVAPPAGTNGWESGTVTLLKVAADGTETGLSTVWQGGTEHAVTKTTHDGETIYTFTGYGNKYYVQNTAEAVEYSDATGLTGASVIYMSDGTTLNLKASPTSALADGINIADNATVSLGVEGSGVILSTNKLVFGEGARADFTLDAGILQIDNENLGAAIKSVNMSNGAELRVQNAFTEKVGTEEDPVEITMTGNSQISLNNGNSWGSRNLWADILIDGQARIGGSSNGNNSTVRGTIAGAGTLELLQSNGNNSYTIASTISDGAGEGESLAVNVTGGKVVLSGSNTYTGGTTISGGIATASSETALGHGDVSVNEATLQLGADLVIKGDFEQIGGGSNIVFATGDTAYDLTIEGAFNGVKETILFGESGKSSTMTIGGNLTSEHTVGLKSGVGASNMNVLKINGASNTFKSLKVSGVDHAKVIFGENSVTTLSGVDGGSAILTNGVHSNTFLQFEQNARLTDQTQKVTFIGGGSDSKLRKNAATGNSTYTLASGEYTLTNLGIEVDTTAGELTVGNLLTNSSVTNAGANLLTVNNAGNTLSGVVAQGGNVKVVNSTTTQVSIGSITAASGKSVTAEIADLSLGALTLNGGTFSTNGNLLLNALSVDVLGYGFDIATETKRVIDLVTAAGTLTLADGLDLSTLVSDTDDFEASLSQDGNKIKLTLVTIPVDPHTYYWEGADDGFWAEQNWSQKDGKTTDLINIAAGLPAGITEADLTLVFSNSGTADNPNTMQLNLAKTVTAIVVKNGYYEFTEPDGGSDVLTCTGDLTLAAADAAHNLVGGHLELNKDFKAAYVYMGAGSSLEINKTLVLTGSADTAENDGKFIIQGAGASLILGDGFTLSNSQIDTTAEGASVVLSGSGTYDLGAGNATLATGVSLSDSWSGTVKVTDATLTSFNIDTLAGGSDSTVEFSGVSGYLSRADQTAQTYTANMKLTDKESASAITFNNGWGGDTRTFAGSVSGDGTMERYGDRGTGQNYTFSGDTSGWNGTFKNNLTRNDFTTNVTFNGSVEINADIINAGVGTLNVTLDDANITADDKSIAVNSDITASRLTLGLAGDTADTRANIALNGAVTVGTLNNYATTIIGGATSVTGATTLGANVTVSGEGASLSLAGTVNTTAAATVTGATVAAGGISTSGAGALTLTNTTVGGNITNTGTLTMSGTIHATASATVSGATVGGNTVTCVEGATLTLQNTSITSTITNNGTLVLTGTVDAGVAGTGPVDTYSNTTTGNGYQTLTMNYVLVSGTAATAATDVTWTVGGEALDTAETPTFDGNTLKVATTDSVNYYINNGATYANTDDEYAAAGALKLNGAELTLTTALKDGLGITVAADNSSIVLDGADVELASSSITNDGNKEVSLKGTGIYNVGSALVLENGVALDSTDWTGTIRTTATQSTVAYTAGSQLFGGSKIDLTADTFTAQDDLYAGATTGKALTLLGDANTLSSLELSGMLTLGSADVASELTVTNALQVATIKVVNLGSTLSAGSLTDGTAISISDALLADLAATESKALTILTLGAAPTTSGITINGNAYNTSFNSTNGQYNYKLVWDDATQSLVVKAALNGAGWNDAPATAGGDYRNRWYATGIVTTGLPASGWSTAPSSTESVVFGDSLTDEHGNQISGSYTGDVIVNGAVVVNNLTVDFWNDLSLNLEFYGGKDVADKADSVTITNNMTVAGIKDVIIGELYTLNDEITLQPSTTEAISFDIGQELSILQGAGLVVATNGSVTAGKLTVRGTLSGHGDITVTGDAAVAGLGILYSGAMYLNPEVIYADTDLGHTPSISIGGNLSNASQIVSVGYGVLSVGGTTTNTGSISLVSGGGKVTLGAEGTASTVTSLANSGTVVVEDGTLIVNGSMTNTGVDIPADSEEPGLSISGGTVTITGNLDNDDAVNISGGKVSIGGDLDNSSSVTISGGEIDITGALNNGNTVSITDATVSAGPVDNDGTITVTGSSLTTDAMDNAGGTLNIAGSTVTVGAENTAVDTESLNNAGGSISITGTAAAGETPAKEGSLVVNGSLTNTTAGTITIGTADDAAADGDQSLVGKLTVTGDLNNAGGTVTLAGTGSSVEVGGDMLLADVTEVDGEVTVSNKGSLSVGAGTDLSVDGDLVANTIDLGFDGSVTVGGDAVANNISIHTGASFTAANATITDTLIVQKGGSLSVGKDVDGTLTGGNLTVGTLSGSGEVHVGTDGMLTIGNDHTFNGVLDNKGGLSFKEVAEDGTVTYHDAVLNSAQTEGQTAGDITASSITISSKAVGTVVEGEGAEAVTKSTTFEMGTLVTDSLIIDGIDSIEDGARLALDSIKTLSTEEGAKVTLTLSQINDKTLIEGTEMTKGESFVNVIIDDVNAAETGADELKAVTYHLMDIAGVTSLDTFELNIDADREQQILAAGQIAELWDGTTPTVALMRALGGTDVYLKVREQTQKEATWDTSDLNTDTSETSTAAGLIVGTVADGVVKLKNAAILDNVDVVNVTIDTTIDLNETDTAADAAAQIHGLSGTNTLTVQGESATGDTADYVEIDDHMKDADGNATRGELGGTLKLDGVTATLDLSGDTVDVTMGDVALKGDLTGGSISIDAQEGVDETSTLDISATDLNISNYKGSADMTGVSETNQVLVDLGNMTGTAGDIDITGEKAEDIYLLEKYFSNIRFDAKEGAVVADRNTSYFSDNFTAESANGEAGMTLADAALLKLNPQLDKDSELGSMLTAIENAGSTTARDELAASLAGASSAVLGMAVSGDVDRQLRAIRNRTTTMGVDQSVANEDMPYFNAWINAEGAMNELSDNGTEGGYKLNSWGGTVGFDVDICPTFTAGMAFTAMYGDLDVTGADTATGDLDTYYLSAFARYSESAWTHTFVATVGTGDISLKRTVLGSEQKVETDALSFGLMYEVGRVFALDEDSSACLQPVFNVTWKHTTVDGYTEDGSDLALKVDEQTVDTVTFGLGARLQAVVGESMYNRTSIFEARVLAKADVGDRNGSADVALAGLPGHKAEVESAEMGAFGLEAGAGLTIPVGEEGGSIFMDASVELRSDYTDVNGTVGYRINF